MASHSNEECLYVTPEAYQEIVHRAVHDPMWSQYFLLINACLENIKHLPTTPDQREQADVENLLIEGLERLADAIAILMPGGLNEFRSYLTNPAHYYRLPTHQIQKSPSPPHFV